MPNLLKNKRYKNYKQYWGVHFSTRLSSFLPICSLRSLYFAFVNPYLLYCNLVWGATYSSHLDPLVKLQKRAIRIINKTSFLSHTNSLFYSNSILKLPDIHKLQLALYVFKLDDLSAFTSNHRYNTRNRNNLVPTFSRLTLTQFSPSFSGIHFWNLLPDEIKRTRTFEIFKNRVKKYLIYQYQELSE